jgi:hypothetical protein
MPKYHFPSKAEKFEIQTYKRPKDFRSLSTTHVPYTGSPHKHPYDAKKLLLLPDPYSTGSFYYEFKTEDISFAEELPNLVNLAGETITMARIWVRKRSLGIRAIPFVVEDTREFEVP